MAVVAATRRSVPNPGGGIVIQEYGASAPDTIGALTTEVCPAGSSQKLLYVGIHYSAAPTYTGTGLTVKIDSALGASYDLTLASGTNNTQDVVYIPDTEIRILPGDAFLITTPAAGGVITSAIGVTFLQQ